MGKKLIITESEKSQIKKLYGLVSEQSTTGGTQNPEITLDLAGTFGSGKYKIPGKVDKLEDIINQIREFKKQNQGNVIEITINSGESQVPNYDREKFPTKGDYRKEAKLPVGDLGKFRSESLKKYLETNAPDILKDSKIVISEPVIGQTKWNPDGGDKPEDEKFTKEQFANFKIKAIGKKDDMSVIPGTDDGCVTGMKIKVYVPKHNCNNAEFFIVLNNTVLSNVNGGYTANLNNAATTLYVGDTKMVPQLLNPAYGYISKRYGVDKKGDVGGARVDEFEVSAEQSKSIVAAGKGLIYVWMISTTKSAHRDIPRVIITKGDKTVYEGAPKVAAGLLLVMDACGNKVTQTPTSDLVAQPNVDTWINKLVQDRSKIDVKEKLPEIPDSKNELLADAAKLNELITSLEDSFFASNDKKADIKQWQDAKAQKNNTISRTYVDIVTLLKKNNWFRKNPQTPDKYVNKNLMGEMFGDIRLDLDKFYPKFNSFYYSDENKNYQPNGVSGSNVVKNLGLNY